MNVSVLVGTDRTLLELALACGTHATPVSADDLAVLARPTTRQPDVLIVDQRDRGAIPPAINAIKRQHPSTGVLMVLPRLDAGLVLEAMRAGVNECVAEPVTRDALSAAFRLVATRRPAANRGDVFAIVGAKGGVGTTTVAVNVATTLNGFRPGGTLLVDLHLTYGDAGTFLGAEPRFSVLDALQNMHRMDATFLRTLVTQTRSGLSLLASSEHSVTAPIDVAPVRMLIELVSAAFPYVVLDVPRTDATALDSLEPATRIVVVANQEVATVRSAARMAAALEQRYGRERVSVVLSRYDAKAEIGLKEVEQVIGRPVSFVLPNHYATALASHNTGRPLVLDSHSALASALASYAGALAGVAPEQQGHDKPLSLLSRLTGRRR
jgi:pilus assembly protein CpaE